MLVKIGIVEPHHLLVLEYLVPACECSLDCLLLLLFKFLDLTSFPVLLCFHELNLELDFGTLGPDKGKHDDCEKEVEKKELPKDDHGDAVEDTEEGAI